MPSTSTQEKYSIETMVQEYWQKAK